MTTAGLSSRTIVGFGSSMFLLGAFFLTVSPVLGDIADELVAPMGALGHPGAAYSLTLGLTALLFSPIQDICQRRWLVLLGSLFHTFGLLFTANCLTWFGFVVGHAVCGFGAGILQPAIYGLLTDRIEAHQRARMIGRVNIGWAATTLIGVPAASFLSDQIGWRSMLMVLSGLWGPIWLLMGRDVLLSRPGLSDSVPRGSFFSLEVIRRTGLQWLFLATVMVFVGFYGCYSFLGMEIRQSLGVGGQGAGAFVFFYGLGFLAGTMKTGTIDQLGPRRALVRFLFPLASVLLVLPAATRSPVTLAVVMVLWGFLQARTFTGLTAIAGSLGPAIKGKALALNASAVMLGGSIGAFVMGSVLSVHGYAVVGLLCAMATGFSAILILVRIPRDSTRSFEEPTSARRMAPVTAGAAGNQIHGS